MNLIQKNDDRNAFTELYNRYWDVLLDNAYQRLKCIETAEEIVQEVFLDLFLRRNEIILKSTLAAYLKTAIKYKIFNIYRSQQIHLQYLADELVSQNVYAQSPEECLEKKELTAVIREAANKMPAKCKEVFLMSRFDQRSNKDISNELGISVSTVKKHITKATNILKAKFKNQTLDFLILVMLIIKH